MKTTIIIPEKYRLQFEVAVEEVNGGKVLRTKKLGMLDMHLCTKQEYLECRIQYESPASLFDTGVDFDLGIVATNKNIMRKLKLKTK